jgi:hypothetical protein
VTPAASLRSNQEPEEKQRQQTDLTSVAERDVRRSQVPTPFPRGNADPPSDKRRHVHIQPRSVRQHRERQRRQPGRGLLEHFNLAEEGEPEYIVWGLNKEITATYTYPDGVTTVQRQGWIYWDLIEDDED